MNRTFYIRPVDQALFDQLDAHLRENKQSFSDYIAKLVRADIAPVVIPSWLVPQ